MMAGNQDADGKQNPADIMTMFFTSLLLQLACWVESLLLVILDPLAALVP